MLENNSHRLVGATMALAVGVSLMGIAHGAVPQQVNQVVTNMKKVIGVDQITSGKYVADDGNLYYIKSNSDDATLIAVGADGSKTINSSATIKGKTYRVTTIGMSSISSVAREKIKNASTFTPYTPTNHIVDLNIPEGITKIYDVQAIYGGGIYNVSSISFPETLQTIDEFSFADITAGSGPVISKLTIPKNVTYIGQSAFSANTSNGRVQEIDFEAGSKLKDIQVRAFYGQSELTKINFADGLQTIGVDAFKNHNASMNVDIPSSVKIIGTDAFAYKTSETGPRTSYHFKGAVPTLGENALGETFKS